MIISSCRITSVCSEAPGKTLRSQLLVFIAALLFLGTPVEAEETGIIARYYEDELPVILKFVNEFPDQSVRSKYSWLTVISWKYDGSRNNGMPVEEVNQAMITLEDTIENKIEPEGYCRHAYSRTGNNLKELVYYIQNRDDFLGAFNKALKDHPRYPIEINFYEDTKWEDFQRILEMIEEEE